MRRAEKFGVMVTRMPKKVESTVRIRIEVNHALQKVRYPAYGE